VRLTGARDIAEAEMIAGLLEREGIRVLVQRAPGFDAPNFLAGGPRELLVRQSDVPRARELVESYFGFGADRPWA